jgi:arabinogalactan endo-1,4-beta-galactosidase
LEHPEYTGDRTIDECIANVNYVAQRYYCDVMIVETGMQCSESVIKNGVEEFTGNDAPQEVIQEGKRLMSRLIKECQENTQGRCKGVFYWEPECRPADGYGLGAFTNDGKPTAIMEAFK